MSGKVIKKRHNRIIFANSYGIFTIKPKQIIKIYISKTYKDDIHINVKLGKKMNQIQIYQINKY